ncbi:hypothetical protein PTI45_03074 [Paenibacillus nuruki]|uniref:Uncharacterized protein n=1 Tax=Paenibacillus nuruki TaxID=1886670 RepID=A0A1E3L145_9BACL|nr:hypothetical protein [Paenibacillus nuruki]ODP27512.1 hypothetical protein PTI45_03074 [Paenibacillus nuruki]
MTMVNKELHTKIGDCDYCNHKNILVMLEFDPDHEHDYLEKCYHGCSDEKSCEEKERMVGNCDHCYMENVYVHYQHDSWGEHIMNQCYYGCGDERNNLNEETQKINVISLNILSQILCYSSTWQVDLLVDGKETSLVLIRLNGETRVKLLEQIINCKNINEIQRLSMQINMN